MKKVRHSKVITFVIGLLILVVMGSVTYFAGYVPEICVTGSNIKESGSYYATQKLSEIVDLQELEEAIYEGTYNCKRSIDISKFKIPYSYKDFLIEYLFKEMVLNFHFDYINITYPDNIITELKPGYDYTSGEYQKMVADIEKAKDKILADIKGNDKLGEVEKALLIHDRLAMMCEYDFTFADISYSLYGALVNGRAVCEGYTKAYDYLLKEVGIESVYCSSQSLYHAWNIVFIDDVPYHVDVTWDDQHWGYSGRGVVGAVSHYNFLRSSKGIYSTDHTANDYDTFPTDTRYDNCFWESSIAAFQLVDNEIYYIDNRNNELKRYCDKKTLCTIPEDWKMGANRARLASGNGELYYSSADAVYSFDLKTAASNKIFEPAIAGNDIYGFYYIDKYLVCDINSHSTNDAGLYQLKQYYDPTVPSSIAQIRVLKVPNKNIYYLGDEFDAEGLKLQVSYTGSPLEYVTSGYTISGFDSSTAGEKAVTISYGGLSTKINVTVKTPVLHYREENLIMNLDETYEIKTTVEPENYPVTWFSSDPSVVSVSSGKIKPVNYGEAIITAQFTYNGVVYSQSCPVKIIGRTYPQIYVQPVQGENYGMFLNINLSDTVGLDSYYFGKDSSPSADKYIPLNGVDKHNVYIPVDSGGDYYLIVKSTSFVKAQLKYEFYETTLDTDGGGGVPERIIVKKGTEYTLPEPTKYSHRFLGWGTSPYATSFVEAVTAESDNTYYAIWEAYDAEEPVVSISSTNNVAPTQTVTLVMEDDIGIVSYYWGRRDAYSENLLIPTQKSKKVVLEKTVSFPDVEYLLVAKDAAGHESSTYIWYEETRLNSVGGSVSPERIISLYGEPIVLPVPTKEGYDFVGWKYGSSIADDGVTIVPRFSNDCFANWKMSDSDAPDISIKSTNTFTSTQKVTVEINDDMEVTSYYWGTESSPKENLFTDIEATRTKTIDETVSESGTYYLIAKDASGKSSTESITFYKTQFDTNGSDETYESILTPSGEIILLPEPKCDGYIFEGWGTSADAESGIRYVAPSENRTYYAVWSRNDACAPVASMKSNKFGYAGLSVYFELSDDTMVSGYFWSQDVRPPGYYQLNQKTATVDVRVKKPGTYHLWVKDEDGNITEKSYTFYQTSLDVNGGETIFTDVISLEGCSVDYDDVWRDGYEFKGWSKSPDDTQGVLNFYPSSNEKYYAVWEGKPTIEISDTELELLKGETVTVTANATSADENILWSSSDIKVATVSDGVITAESVGKTVITAEFVHNGRIYSENCKITVGDQTEGLLAIRVTKLPDKTTYAEIKESLDLTGGELTLYFDDGTEKVVALSAAIVGNFESSKIGEQTLTVVYSGKTTTFDVIVTEKKLVSIEVYKAPDRKVYPQYKEMLNLSGGTVALNYDNGSQSVICITPDMVSGFDNTKPGVQVLTVTYKGMTATFDIEVVRSDFTSIEITTIPEKLRFSHKEEKIDVTGGKITLYYDDGSTREIDIAEYMARNFVRYQVGTQSIDVVFGGKKASYNVYMYIEGLKSIYMSMLPDKTVYVEGCEEFDPYGGVVTTTLENGSVLSFILDESMVSGFDNTKVGTQTLTVNLDGVTTTFDIEVVKNTLTDIVVSELPDKLTYLESYDDLDVTGGKITVYYGNYTSEEIDLTRDMVSGFDNTKVGKQKLVVSYENCSTDYEVEIIKKKLEMIRMYSLPNKLEYIEGERFSITGGNIELCYNNDTTEIITFDEDMVYGFDSTKPGDQTITVVYEGMTTSFDIRIVQDTQEKPIEPPVTEPEVPDDTEDPIPVDPEIPINPSDPENDLTDPENPFEGSGEDDTKPSEPSNPTEPVESTTPSVEDNTEPSTDDSEEPEKPTEPAEDKGILGDVNGDGKVNIKDATQIQKTVAKLVSLTDVEVIRADANGDGKVNIKDATVIQKFIAKIETGLPVGEQIF